MNKRNNGMALLTVLMVLLLASLSVAALLNSSLLSGKMAFYGQQQLVIKQQAFAEHRQKLVLWLQQAELAESAASIRMAVSCPGENEPIAQTSSCNLLLLTTVTGQGESLPPVRYHSLILSRSPSEPAECAACNGQQILLATYTDETGGF